MLNSSWMRFYETHSMTTFEGTRGFLEATVAAIGQTHHQIEGYSCLQDFVLRHGQAMGDSTKSRVKRGRMGYCYANASRLAMRNPEYIYCEGYAAVVFPVMHGWCVNRDGQVVDPTWGEDGVDYFGIPIKRKYLMRALAIQGSYGLIDQWTLRWPMLREKPEEWREEIVKNAA